MSMKVTRDEFVGVEKMGEDELRDLAHELLSENAKLRSERDLYSSLVEDMDHPDTANQLRDENAKLRELVAHYDHAVTVHDVKPVEVLEWSARCDALRKELGIEGDE